MGTKNMRIHVFRLQLDEKPTERDRKVIEACMKLAEKPLSDGKLPSFYLGTVIGRKIQRTVD